MKILFVCTGNTCRSPMAEALLRARLEAAGLTEHEVASAGVFADAGMGASAGAIGAMQRRGIDLTGHRATQLTAERLGQADLILVMSPSHITAVRNLDPDALPRLLMEYARGEDAAIEDPFGGDDAVYEYVASQIEEAIEALVERITR